MPTLRRALLSLALGVCVALPAAAQTPVTSSGEPQASNTGSVPAGAPAVNPASPPGTAYNQPNAGSIGPSPAGTVPSSSSAPSGPETRVNPATGASIAPPPPGAPKGPPGAGPNRLNFELKFAPEKGKKEGGAALGSAVTLDYKRDDYAVLTGAVQVHYQDLDLSGDHVEINLTTKEVVAQGNVILDQGPKRMTGTTLNFDLDTKTGKMLQATAFVAADYFFAGVEIDKTGDDSYTVYNGIFTACDQKTPDWSFRLQRADVDVEGYAHMRHVTFRVKQVPVLFTPYLLYPAKKDRASGLLVPTVEYTGERGAALNLAYFQTLGQSYDTTFHLTPFLRGYVGGGDEFRYHPTEGTWGDWTGYAVRDPVDKDKLRWKVDVNHETDDLPFGMRLVVHYQKYSDFDYLRDFERDFDTSSLRFIDSRAFITGNWGPNLLNIQLDDNQILFNTGTDFTSDVDQKKLPEFEYQLRSTKIGPTPFYAQMDNFFDYLEINRPGSYSGTYGRLDLFPQITLPVNTFPWLSLSVTGGYRLTEYQKSINPTTGLSFENQGLTRSLPYGSAEIVGPSFSKIMEYEIADFAKFKHVIEPRITYTYYGLFTDAQQLKVPQFDDIDAPLSTNNVRIALDNRILAKPDTADASAREILLFEIARMYSFDSAFPLDQSTTDLKTASDASPIDFMLRFAPTEKLSTKGEVEYSTFFKRIESTSLSSDWSFGNNQTLGLTWFTNYIPESGVSESNQVRVNTALDIIPQRLSIQAQVGWDIQNHLIGQQYYAINWAAQCYGFRLEFRKFEALEGPRLSDTDIRFSITLKGIGTLLDLNSRAVNSAP
jgi:LPS-assembly protein